MSRYLTYAASLLLTLVFAALAWRYGTVWAWPLAIAVAFAALGSWDLIQTRSTLRRNYPILAHFRYGLESIGP